MSKPTQRHMPGKKRARRSHHALKKIATILCKKCKKPKLPHRVCKECRKV